MARFALLVAAVVLATAVLAADAARLCDKCTGKSTAASAGPAASAAGERPSVFPFATMMTHPTFFCDVFCSEPASTTGAAGSHVRSRKPIGAGAGAAAAGGSKSMPRVSGDDSKPDAVAAPALAPFVFFPGLTAQVLEAKLDHFKPPVVYCPSNKDWYVIWMEAAMLVPGLDACFFGPFGQSFDNSTGGWSSQPGMQVRSQDYGSWQGILGFSMLGKYLPMYQQLYQNLTTYGYVDKVTTFVASYDFRYAPGHLMETDFLPQTMQLVETAFNNTGRRVTIVGHSYGCSMGHRFLRAVPESWKARYISQFVSFSGPYEGAPVTAYIALSGAMAGAHNGGIDINPKHLAEVAKRIGVGYGLLPFPDSIAGQSTIISILNKNYTAADFAEMFAALPDEKGGNWAGRYNSVRETLDSAAPNVTVHCVNGYGSKTLLTAMFNVTDPTGVQPYAVEYTDGDTVVDRGSLNRCQRWGNEQAPPVSSWEIPGLIHGEAPFIPQVFQWWMQVMQSTQ